MCVCARVGACVCVGAWVGGWLVRCDGFEGTLFGVGVTVNQREVTRAAKATLKWTPGPTIGKLGCWSLAAI